MVSMEGLHGTRDNNSNGREMEYIKTSNSDAL